jgi:hypothetical protein
MPPSTETLAKYAAVMGPDAALESLVEREEVALWLECGASGVSWLFVLGKPSDDDFRRFAGGTSYSGDDLVLRRCPTSEANAAALRVTYGSALDRYGVEIDSTLDTSAEDYATALERMLYRLLEPLVGASGQSGGGR